MKVAAVAAAVLVAAVSSAHAQTAADSAAPTPPAPAVAAPAGQVILPADTIIQMTPVQEISSIDMKEGDSHILQVAMDVSHNGVVVIPRGSPVKATVTWRTGKGIGGKSAKYDLTFNTVTVNGKSYALKGKHRQEGKGNTLGAVLGSILITGRSAIMQSGQIVSGFTAEPIPAA